MTAVIHALFGSVIGFWFHNTWLVFILGIISHYFLDFIPHWDYLSKIGKEPDKIKKIFIDSFASSLIIFLVVLSQPQEFFSILAGAIGALLPDILQFFYLIMDVKWLEPTYRFHHKIHKWKHLSFWQGLPCTILVIIVSIIALWG